MQKFLEVDSCDTVTSWAATKARELKEFSRDSRHKPANHCDEIRIRQEQYVQVKIEAISWRAHNLLALLCSRLTAP